MRGIQVQIPDGLALGSIDANGHRKMKKVVGRAEVKQFAEESGIDWFIVGPGNRRDWETNLVPQMQSQGYRVYKL